MDVEVTAPPRWAFCAARVRLACKAEGTKVDSRAVDNGS
jgi:hypothetical protein